jgi:hypothetical protein
VAQEVDETSEVVYVDNDPEVLSYGRMMLAEDPETTAVLGADMRDTEAIFESEEVRRLLRDGQPVAALFVSVLHCIPDDDDPWALVNRVARRLPPDSYMVISHLASDHPELRKQVTEFMRRVTGGQWGRVRSTQEVERYFEHLELLETQKPVEVSRWLPDSDFAPRQEDPAPEWIEFGAVARIR